MPAWGGREQVAVTGDQAVTGDAMIRQALAAIVADPELGADALADPGRMASVLSDYLPDAPAQCAVLKAAVSAGVPGMLTARSDMPPAGAVRLAAAAMTERTGYPAETAEWAARELATALGLTSPEPTEVPGPLTVTATPRVPLSAPPAPSPGTAASAPASPLAVVVGRRGGGGPGRRGVRLRGGVPAGAAWLPSRADAAGELGSGAGVFDHARQFPGWHGSRCGVR
jgi:hypothetical protein